ncbi:MAG: hypothetical protein JSW66_17880 [Phycisphaerales bacterium]|nr:MAG: hypothetical protein JSW66_17880 [Phycisphaerales bacterium]
MNKTIESLGLGLLRLLCYSYGGFLLVVCAACFSGSETRAVIDALHPSVAVLAIIVIGAAIYVLHRTVVVPVHYLLLSVFFRMGDQARGAGEHGEFSANPIRYLGEALGVPLRKRITAYHILRRSDFFPSRDSLDVAHAENGLLIMTGVGLLIATGLALSQGKSFALTVTLFVLSLVFLAASFRAEWVQHSVECSMIKDHPVEAMKILARIGILRPEDVEATRELKDLRDGEALEMLGDEEGDPEQPSAHGAL